MEDLNVTHSPSLSVSQTDPAPQTTTWILHNATYPVPIADESVNFGLLGVSVIAVFVMILLMMVMVLRYIAHQKGTYYTNEEDLAFKSDPEVQDVSESLEDPEEEEP
ncbi:glycophorin-C [Pimephales promelas]|uniref:glycophorin-C n=1 Tax=Pimephales promelas TaxID=90988 RepID=UPI0019558420|nr:glycophorin-C [Pimephales promelas]XP_039538431.1 glycophorin-C [Pimephales promelas]